MKKLIFIFLSVLTVACSTDKNNSNKIVFNNGYAIYVDSLNNLIALKHVEGRDSLILTFDNGMVFHRWNKDSSERVYLFDEKDNLYKIRYENVVRGQNPIEQNINIDSISSVFCIKSSTGLVISSNVPDTVNVGDIITVNHRTCDSVFPFFRLNISSSERPFSTNRKELLRSFHFYNICGGTDSFRFFNKGYNYYNGYIDNYRFMEDSSIATIRSFFNYRVYVK